MSRLTGHEKPAPAFRRRVFYLTMNECFTTNIKNGYRDPANYFFQPYFLNCFCRRFANDLSVIWN